MPGLAHLAHKISSTRLSAESSAELPTQPRVGCLQPECLFRTGGSWNTVLARAFGQSAWCGSASQRALPGTSPARKANNSGMTTCSNASCATRSDAWRRPASLGTQATFNTTERSCRSWRMYDWARKLTAQLRGDDALAWNTARVCGPSRNLRL